MTRPVAPGIFDGLIFGHDAHVALWVAERIPEMRGRSFGPGAAIGIIQDGRIVGGVVYSMFFDHPDGGDISVSAAFEPKCRITRAMWRRLFGYPFTQLKCGRISIATLRKNKRARAFAERTGFKLEGVRRQGFGRQDIFLYGLLKADCRFL